MRTPSGGASAAPAFAAVCHVSNAASKTKRGMMKTAHVTPPQLAHEVQQDDGRDPRWTAPLRASCAHTKTDAQARKTKVESAGSKASSTVEADASAADANSTMNMRSVRRPSEKATHIAPQPYPLRFGTLGVLGSREETLSSSSLPVKSLRML